MNELRDVYSAEDDWKGAHKERTPQAFRTSMGDLAGALVETPIGSPYTRIP